MDSTSFMAMRGTSGWREVPVARSSAIPSRDGAVRFRPHAPSPAGPAAVQPPACLMLTSVKSVLRRVATNASLAISSLTPGNWDLGGAAPFGTGCALAFSNGEPSLANRTTSVDKLVDADLHVLAPRIAKAHDELGIDHRGCSVGPVTLRQPPAIPGSGSDSAAMHNVRA